MVKNPEILRKFEAEYARNEKLDFASRREIFEAMAERAASAGVLVRKDPFEGLETIIRVARIVNGMRP